MASVLREVPQLGLCQIVAFIALPFPVADTDAATSRVAAKRKREQGKAATFP